MENEIQIFNNEHFGKIRTVQINNTTHFVASDIAKALGYKNTRDAIIKHCRWVAKRDIPHPQNESKTIEVNVIPEGDIYRLVASSELPGAEKFESWIFDKVLPEIRHTGGYIPSDETDTEDDIMAKALLIANRKIELKNKAIAEKERKLIEQQPKVAFADAISSSKTSILVGDLAKLLKQSGIDIGGTRLFEKLRKEGYLIKKKSSSYNMPTQYSMELGLFEIKETSIAHSDGQISISKTPKVTGKGQIYFINKYKNVS